MRKLLYFVITTMVEKLGSTGTLHLATSSEVESQCTKQKDFYDSLKEMTQGQILIGTQQEKLRPGLKIQLLKD